MALTRAEINRRYRERHPDRRKATVARYAETHREQLQARRLAWRAKNPDAVRMIGRRHDAARREKRSAFSATHRDLMRARAAAWRAKNPEAARAAVNRRRAKLENATGSHTIAEWREKCELFAFCCAYCGETRPLTRDHKTPLSRGGTDDIGNIVPACPSCNSTKGTRTATEFLTIRRAA